MIKSEVRRAGLMASNWDKMRKRLMPKIERGTRAAADVLLAAADELVPVDKQALKDSGKVRKKSGGLEAEFIVGYGSKLFTAEAYGEARAERPPHMYAVYVHESVIKFLEIPYETQRAAMVEALNKQLHS